MLYNDAVEIAVRRCDISQIARLAHPMQTPVFGVRMDRAKRFASRCGGAAWVLLECCLCAAW
eukprot:4656270-Lingulodinium_polyedra.AAC.1